MRYRVVLKPGAQRQLDRLRGVTFTAARGVVLSLANDPQPVGAARLGGAPGLWRLRVVIDGREWRVIYLIDDSLRKVTVTLVVARAKGRFQAP